jgi:hypothetical protein
MDLYGSIFCRIIVNGYCPHDAVNSYGGGVGKVSMLHGVPGIFCIDIRLCVTNQKKCEKSETREVR